MRYELNIEPWFIGPDPAESEEEMQQLQWKAAGSLDRAIQIARGPGIYMVYKKGRLLYIGETTNLPMRLRQHRLCLIRFAVDRKPFTISFARFEGEKAARKSIERTLIERYRSKGITNIREIEEELWADPWS